MIISNWVRHPVQFWSTMVVGPTSLKNGGHRSVADGVVKRDVRNWADLTKDVSYKYIT